MYQYDGHRFYRRQVICIPAQVGTVHSTILGGKHVDMPIDEYYKQEAARIPWGEYFERGGWCAVVRAE